jgi:hypothetical protein
MSEARPHADVRFAEDVSVLDRNRLLVVLGALVPSIAVLADLAEGNVAARLLVAGSATDVAALGRSAARWLTTSGSAESIVVLQRRAPRTSSSEPTVTYSVDAGRPPTGFPQRPCAARPQDTACGY